MALIVPLVSIVAPPANTTTVVSDDIDTHVLQAARAIAALNTNVVNIESRLAAVEAGGPAAGNPVTVTITASQEAALAAVTPGMLVVLQGPTQRFYAVAQ